MVLTVETEKSVVEDVDVILLFVFFFFFFLLALV
jgi:hypothetical protein